MYQPNCPKCGEQTERVKDESVHTCPACTFSATTDYLVGYWDGAASLNEAQKALEAVKDTLEVAGLNGVVLWIRPPYQAKGVHESAIERIDAALEKK